MSRIKLSTREIEVFELLVDGKTRKEIAVELGLSSWTVKSYITYVYSKAGVHSAKELMLLVASDEQVRAACERRAGMGDARPAAHARNWPGADAGFIGCLDVGWDAR